MQSNYDKTGPLGTLDILIRSTPLIGLPALPYTYFVYRELLSTTHTLTELEEAHVSRKQISITYSITGPLHRKHASRILRSYGIE